MSAAEKKGGQSRDTFCASTARGLISQFKSRLSLPPFLRLSDRKSLFVAPMKKWGEDGWKGRRKARAICGANCEAADRITSRNRTSSGTRFECGTCAGERQCLATVLQRVTRRANTVKFLREHSPATSPARGDECSQVLSPASAIHFSIFAAQIAH